MKEYNLRLIEVRRRPAKARRIFVSLRAICRLMVFCLLAASVSHAVVKAAVAESTAATDYIDSAEQITFDDDRDFIGREASSPKLHIVLDPGHGGIQSGAERDSVEEKDLNIKIAHYLKAELEKYEGVTVTLTRDDDETVELEERTEIALDENADVLISLHNNSTGPCCPYDNGSTVLVAKGNYNTEDETKEQMAEEEQKLGCNILNELEAVGLTNQGLLLRDSEADERYEDGTLADYYAIIRNGVLKNLPSILIEHAFLDNDSDYDTYLSSDEGLRTLAQADARGIARYYQLISKETGEILPELDDYQAKLVHVRDGRAENNDITYQTYYVEETVGTDASGKADAETKTSTDASGTVGGADNSVSAKNSVAVDETAKNSTSIENSTEAEGTPEDGRVNDDTFSGESQTVVSREDDVLEKDRDVGRSTFVITLAVIALILLGAAGGVLWFVLRKRK